MTREQIIEAIIEATKPNIPSMMFLDDISLLKLYEEKVRFKNSKILDTISKHISLELNEIGINDIIDLKFYRKSPLPSADATRPKYQLTTPSGAIYFKFGLTENEICSEIFSYYLAKLLEIPVAKTALAFYKNTLGVASWDIGDYIEPDDSNSYSIGDFINITGFVEMCLYDYLIMNEDRHAGNWGYKDNTVKPLFDHNYCFGGEDMPRDFDSFMQHVTSPLTAIGDYQNRHDAILEKLIELRPHEVKQFLEKVDSLPEIDIEILSEIYPRTYSMVRKLFYARKLYMIQKGWEYGI